MLDKIICRWIKKQTVTYDDVINRMCNYFIIYAEIINIIFLSPVIKAIYDPEYLEMTAIMVFINMIFVSPFVIIYLIIKFILEKLGLFDEMIKTIIAKCPENSTIMKKDNNWDLENVEKLIIMFLGAIFFILFLIMFAEMIIYDKFIQGSP